jgi:hypothetical protein
VSGFAGQGRLFFLLHSLFSNLMALQNNGSFIPTANEFLAHWADANAGLGSAPLLLPEEPGIIPAGFARADLLTLRNSLQSQLDAVQDKLNDLQIASGALDILKTKMYKRLTLFLEVVDGYYANTEFYRARPEAPGIGAGEEKFCAPLRDMKSLWVKLNAAPAPAGVTLPIVLNEGTIALPAGVVAGLFATDFDLLKAKYEARANAAQAVNLARSARDRSMEKLRAVLVSYRTAAVPRLAGNATLLATLPRVTPQPGHTPDAVAVTAVFVAPDIAQVTHTESDDTDFKEYQLRGTEDAVVLATHNVRTPSPFTTQLGLGTPGGAVSLWVYVVTNDGNERASPRAVVHRPA